MTDKELEIIKTTEKWPIKFSDIFNSYFIIVFPIAIILPSIVELNSGYNNNLFELKLAATIQITIGILLLIFIVIRLTQNRKFYSYYTNKISNDDIKQIANNLKFQNLKFYKKNYFICTTNITWFSWGEKITIIIDTDRILVNSRPSQPITICKDRCNIKNILKEIDINLQKK